MTCSGACATFSRMSSNAPQMTLFGDTAPAPRDSDSLERVASTHMEPNAENFRNWLHDTLKMLAGTDRNPWNPVDARYYRVLFDLRSQWLPAEEGQSLRNSFAVHWRRLEIVESQLPST